MQETTPITPTEIDPKRRYLCRHVFTEGHRCGSPALRGQNLCYNHSRVRREAGLSGTSGTFPMPRIDDRASIQLALFEVLSRLAGGDIEYKRGSILLYGLQIASSNLQRREKTAADQQPQVEEVTADYYLGDLAPITEIVDHSVQTAPTADRLILAAVQAVGTQPASAIELETSRTHCDRRIGPPINSGAKSRPTGPVSRAFSTQVSTKFRVPHPWRVLCAKGGRRRLSPVLQNRTRNCSNVIAVSLKLSSFQLENQAFRPLRY